MDTVNSFVHSHPILTGVCATAIAGVLFLRRRKAKIPRFKEAVQLRGKTVIVTGGSGGIGYETAVELAQRGANVIIASRDRERNEKAAAGIRARVQSAQVIAETLDLASFESVRAFARWFKAQNMPLNILIENAGFWGPYVRSVDELECTAQVNHFGHFFLVRELWDSIVQNGTRVVVVSSKLHESVTMETMDKYVLKAHVEDVCKFNYRASEAYCASKLANVLFAEELNRRLLSAKSTARAYSLSPGFVATRLADQAIPGQVLKVLKRGLLRILSWLVIRTPEEGCQTTLYAALSADERLQGGGQYCRDCTVSACSPLVRAFPDMARELWQLSETHYNRLRQRQH